MDIVFKQRDNDSATFDREAITIMLLQLDDPKIEQPTLVEFLEQIKSNLTPVCQECEIIKQIIKDQRS